MQINTLQLLNFRCFEDLTLHFNPHFNVLIGDNMAGKTSVLKALSIATTAYSMNMAANGVFNPINREDMRLVNVLKNTEGIDDAAFEFQCPVSIIVQEGFLHTKPITWNVERKDAPPKKTLWGKILKNIAEKDKDKISKGESVLLPIIVFYEANRDIPNLIKQDGEPVIAIADTKKLGSRREGYEYCMKSNSDVNIRTLQTWFKTKQIVGNGKGSVYLNVVKNALKGCLEHCEDIYFNIEYGELCMTMDDGRIIPFSFLSSGVKNMLHIVFDIAYRCVTLNSHLQENAALETNGIVMIDELDAHLHPKWEQRIVQNLKTAFPKIQFFVTAHSPHIIASAAAGEVIDMNNAIDATEIYPEQQSFQGWQLQYILKDVMEMKNASSPYNSLVMPLLEKLQMAFDTKNVVDYDEILLELAEVLNPNDPDLSFYKMQKGRIV